MQKGNKMAKRGDVDFSLLLSAIVLSIIGLIMVFSSSMPHAISKYENAYHFFKRHAIFLVIGWMMMIVFMNINYQLWNRLSPIAFGISLVLAFTVIATPLGVERNGAYRWISIGGFEFMPSDTIKLASVMFMATFLSNKQKDIKSFFHGTMMGGIVIIISIMFTVKEDLGTTVIIFSSLAIMLFVGGLNFLHLGIAMPFVGIVGFIGFKNLEGFRKDRLIAFRNPFEYKQDIGWQVVQSLYAIGSGGIFGVGLGKSRQKFFYLSEAYNDFIFAIIAEELGLVGSIMIIGLYILLVSRGIKIAINVDDLYGKFLATGITAIIAVQSLVHIAVVTSSIPTTGVTLPFISYGGTSLVIMLAAVGILLNISRYSNLDRS